MGQVRENGCEALPSPMAGALLIPVRRRDGSVRGCIWIDEADAPWATRFRWGIRRGGYAYRHESHRTEGRGTIAMHREMLGLAVGDARQGEHRNRIRLDNRRSNLRVVGSQAQNLENVPARGRIRGVHWYGPGLKHWRARVQQNRKGITLGYFHTPEEAEQVVRAWRAEHMPYSNE